MKKCCFLLILLFFLTLTFFSASSFDRNEVQKKYTKEDIMEFFHSARRYEFIDDYHNKDEGIFVLTTKAYYQIGVNDDDSIRLKLVKTRLEYDSGFMVLGTIIFFCIIGIIIFIVIRKPKRKYNTT